jgi:hypothetical protein
MTLKTYAIWILAAACLLVLVMPVQADTVDDQNVNVIYQTSFANDPHWITNNPSTDYWEPGAQKYHFSIEPSTGSYAYVPVNFKDTSFNLDYDLLLTRVDDSTTFRLGFSGKEMDPEKGPCILTEFTNAKFGQIMWLQVVTPGNKILNINSQSGVTAYTGSTAKYEINKTYHVSVAYNKDLNLITMKVNDKQSGQEIWSYYIKTNDDLTGMNRIWIGSIGDYGMMGTYAQGELDNVQVTSPVEVTPTPTQAAVVSSTTAPVTPTKKATPKATVPTPYPTTTPQSPSSLLVPLAALGVIGGYFLVSRKEE